VLKVSRHSRQLPAVQEPGGYQPGCCIAMLVSMPVAVKPIATGAGVPTSRSIMTDIVRNLLRSLDDERGAPLLSARPATALALTTPRRPGPLVATAPGSDQQLALATARLKRHVAGLHRHIDSPMADSLTCAICGAMHSQASQ